MGGRPTRQRKAVSHALTQYEDFVSAQELHGLLVEDGHGIGLTTVYRALRDLEAEGGVDVVRDEAGGRRYRRRPTDGHRHYLLCRDCGQSRPVDSEVVEEWAAGIAAATGYAAVEHTVELTGICTDCRPAGDEGAPTCHGNPWERDPDIPGPARSFAR
ncbi:Fur family transcriptional regulator [Streptomyces justiciae]|uniref:Fur family transcriptional regulator n=1 Tax=Streptomyces justiciae TaxID=2780140 RepID=UPI00211855B8|nr:Fur family transcriptional regulator [Streptomyces justiciae]MCW8380682.1 transcriptional repressor [Streptomyces justiciae]